MSKTFVSVVALLVVSAFSAQPASAQRVRIGGSVRVSDHVVVGFSYGRPYLAEDRYYRLRYRHAKLHRRLSRTHGRYHRAVEREHERLHRDLYRGYASRRDHREWHEAVEYEHHEHHDDLDRQHGRSHRRARHHRGHR